MSAEPTNAGAFGEGSGAALALLIVQSAVQVLHDVAMFDSAGVSGAKV